MTTTITTPDKLVRPIKPKQPPNKLHLFDRDDGAVARELGIEVKMLCGIWGWPSRKPGPQAKVGEIGNLRCARCEAALIRRDRERGTR